MSEKPILRYGDWKDNGHLLRDVARLGYLKPTDLVLDPTYGRGLWWTKFRPERLVIGNRDQDGSDFRNLDFRDGLFDAIAYDPPYVCVDMQTEILTEHGWLFGHEVEQGDLAYTLNHKTGTGEWQPILEVIRLPRAKRQMLSLSGNGHSSLTTMEHRWPVLSRRRTGAVRRYEREWATSATFRSDDLVPICAPHSGAPSEAKFSDAFVEVVAWFWTEGHLEKSRNGSTSAYGNIVQSHVVNSDNCVRIRSALTRAFGPDAGHFPRLGRVSDGIPRWREARDGHKEVFWFSSDLGRILVEVAPGRVPTRQFLNSLTAAQVNLFIDISMRADGHSRSTSDTLGQKSREAAESFQYACTLAGIGSSMHQLGSGMWNVRLRRRPTMKPFRNSPTVVEHDGPVWCVRTPTSTWLARRNGTVFFTGNCKGGRTTSGIEEMDSRYGLDDTPHTPAGLQDLINTGLREMYRVVKTNGIVLCKCQDYVSSGTLWPGVYKTISAAEQFIGLELVDLFVMVKKNGGPQDKNRTRKGKDKDGKEIRVKSVQHHARNNGSTLLVFRKPKW